MIPNVDERVLTSEFDLKNNAILKAEAPWIKRCDFGIKFTDEIQLIDNNQESESESATEQEEEENEKSREQESDDQEGMEQQTIRESQMDERHYMRNYVKKQKDKLMASVSEQVLKNEFDFFKEFNGKE